MPEFQPLDSDGHVLRDAQGRTVILRGYNIKVNGLFDVTPDNGQPVREVIPLLDDTDFTLMQKSGRQRPPPPGELERVRAAQGNSSRPTSTRSTAFLELACARTASTLLLDFHEDGWSKDLCEDGAPAWATVVTATAERWRLAGLPHVERGAQRPFELLRQNVNDLQGAFATMYQQFAAHFVNEELVFGYEIFNEPISLGSR